VKIKRSRPCTTSQPDSDAHRQERRSLYLRKMKELCFNCLARDHKGIACRNPTRCWRCRRFGHTSTECNPSCLVQPPNRHPSLNPRDASTPQHSARDVGVIIDDNILFGHNTSSTTYERMMDPVLLEADLMDLRCDTKGSSSTPLLTVSTLSVVNHHPSSGATG
jgi:hypothetical protein